MLSQAFHSSSTHATADTNWPGFQPAAVHAVCSSGRQSIPGGKLGAPRDRQVHLWAAWLDAPASVRAACQKTLSPDELERARRFRFEQHRNRYIMAHGWLRQLLAAYLGCSASAVEFEVTAKGKPALAGELAQSSGLQFNLAHSDDLSLVAIAHQFPVGVDVERIRKLQDAEMLVARFFSKTESSKFSLLPESQRDAAFFNLWTRKEAWLKATGEGIAHLLNRVVVSFVPGEPARLLRVPEHFTGPSQWSLCDLSPAPGFAAAVAVAAPDAEPVCRSWGHDFMGFAL